MKHFIRLSDAILAGQPVTLAHLLLQITMLNSSITIPSSEREQSDQSADTHSYGNELIPEEHGEDVGVGEVARLSWRDHSSVIAECISGLICQSSLDAYASVSAADKALLRTQALNVMGFLGVCDFHTLDHTSLPAWPDSTFKDVTTVTDIKYRLLTLTYRTMWSNSPTVHIALHL